MANQKMRCGQIAVEMEEEQLLWTDRKRVTVFALPWSFTKYELTSTKLLVSVGLLNRQEDEIRLYRVRDVSLSQSLWERMGNVGTLKVISTDATTPECVLRHVKNPRQVKDVISHTVEQARKKSGVRASELMGRAGNEDPSDNDQFQDMDGDGIDDRLQ